MKKLLSCLAFVLVFFVLLLAVTNVLIPKELNRYYILNEYLETHPEENMHDVQVFGACHSYTSFNPVYLEELTGEGSFVYGAAGEIIPTTYARMAHQFRIHTPKVALVEIWGINPYETYDTQKNIFGDYLASNLESLPFSLEKQEVVRDFSHMMYQDIGLLTMNFPIVTYKDRVLDKSLSDVDFHYTFEDTLVEDDENYMYGYTYEEMENRLYNHGYRANLSRPVLEYEERQSTVEDGAFLEIEADIVKYIEKIIDLCRDKGVELIFYRAPYVSTENELKKLSHLSAICQENDVLFLDLEQQIEFDYERDFLDYEHLSEFGANRATAFLAPYILEGLGKGADTSAPVRENLVAALDAWQTGGDENTVTVADGTLTLVSGTTRSGFKAFDSLDDVASLRGHALLGTFSVEGGACENLALKIACFDAEGKELAFASASPEEGEVTLSLVVSPNTERICVGIFSDWYVEGGPQVGETLTISDVRLYQA